MLPPADAASLFRSPSLRPLFMCPLSARPLAPLSPPRSCSGGEQGCFPEPHQPSPTLGGGPPLKCRPHPPPRPLLLLAHCPLFTNRHRPSSPPSRRHTPPRPAACARRCLLKRRAARGDGRFSPSPSPPHTTSTRGLLICHSQSIHAPSTFLPCPLKKPSLEPPLICLPPPPRPKQWRRLFPFFKSHKLSLFAAGPPPLASAPPCGPKPPLLPWSLHHTTKPQFPPSFSAHLITAISVPRRTIHLSSPFFHTYRVAATMMTTALAPFCLPPTHTTPPRLLLLLVSTARAAALERGRGGTRALARQQPHQKGRMRCARACRLEPARGATLSARFSFVLAARSFSRRADGFLIDKWPCRQTRTAGSRSALCTH